MPEGSAGIERNFVAYLKDAGEDRAGHVVRRPLRLRRVHHGGCARGRLVLRRRGEDDRRSRQSCGTARPTSRSTRTTTRRPTPWTTSIGTRSEINGAGVGYVVGIYAQDQRGRNGVPIRDDRTRHVLASHDGAVEPRRRRHRAASALVVARCCSAAARRRRNRPGTSPATWPTGSVSTPCTSTCASCRRSPTPTTGPARKARPATTPASTTSRRRCGQGFRRRDPGIRAARAWRRPVSRR